MEQDIEKIDRFITIMKSDFRTGLNYKYELEAIEHLIKAYKELEYKYNKALSDLVQAEHKNKELEEENKIIKGNYYTLCADIQMVTSELGFPEDTIIADEMISMIKDNYIPVSLVEKKIRELDIKITYIESQYTNGGQNCNSNYLSALYQKQILQELLEKR